ncbi:hypothetical protein WA026_007530 [Henosepilachna vigintioctopunctata]|uniref:Lipase n=1 Tax=Henosepilachna vigintioctopunctata TaxID=420089 RepID=A0AAW1UUD5_9CUCU
MVSMVRACLLVSLCIYMGVGGWDMVFDRDGDLSLDDLVKRLNYDGIQSYYLTTKDGYIINVERIKRKNAEKLVPIIFVHGMTACAKSFFVKKNGSAPIIFANKGYDVWLLNSRGTENSRGHIKWNATSDREFWMFSWQEIGLIDLPATIDLVLENNIHDKVVLLGHSEGSTVIFVTLSDMPEYNAKVALSIHWGVSVYHERCSTVELVTSICRMEPVLSQILDSIGLFSIVPSLGLKYVVRDLCRYTIFKDMCFEAAKFFIQSDEQIQHVTDWSFLISQILCGGSTREIYHFMQVANTGRFARYNYGAKMNMKLYNTTEPPLFHLENVNSVTVLYCGKNDIFCTNSDMEKLTSQLSNIASTDFKGKSIFSHNDYLIARDVREVVYKEILKIIKKYTS